MPPVFHLAFQWISIHCYEIYKWIGTDMYIVLDSNIWIETWGLNTAMGATTRFYIKLKNAKLALPEVIKEEVKRNLCNSLTACSSEIEENHRRLLSIFGRLKEVVLPSAEEIKAKVDSLFDEVKLDVHDVPFTLESAKSSLFKIYDKVPPNSVKNQQFKDGVIWSDCMKLLEKEDVIFVSKDGAFYKDKNYKEGLAINLQEEADRYKNKFRIFSSLDDLLAEIKTDVSIDKIVLVSQFTRLTDDSIKSILDFNGFSISSEPTVKVSSFITGDPGRLCIEFEIVFDCSDERDEGRKNGVLVLKGDGYYNVNEKEFIELKNLGEGLSFVDATGERKTSNKVLFSMHVGPRIEVHSIKRKIDSA